MLVSCCNFKGGQGKSFWSAILADHFGSGTEILDLDPRQGDSVHWAGKTDGRFVSSLVWPKDAKQALQQAVASNKWIIADCPPAEDAVTRWVLAYSTALLIPICPEGSQDARGFGRMTSAVADARIVNPKLKAAVVLNKSRKTAINKGFVEMLEKWHAPRNGLAVLGSVPLHVDLSESYGSGEAPASPEIANVMARFKLFMDLKID